MSEQEGPRTEQEIVGVYKQMRQDVGQAGEKLNDLDAQVPPPPSPPSPLPFVAYHQPGSASDPLCKIISKCVSRGPQQRTVAISIISF